MTNVNALFQQIQSRGERLTIQRRLVIAALCSQLRHMAIVNIRKQIQETGHDLPEPTIYRILQWLKELEIVSQTDMGEKGIVYELVSTPPHHHLICLSCGGVTDIADVSFADLRQQLRSTHGFDPRIEHMAVYGYCAECREDL